MKKQILKSVLGVTAIAIITLGLFSFNSTKITKTEITKGKTTQSTFHKNINVNGVNIFYREAGDVSKPTILLLHGYPTSSHMFRNLITDLSVRYHVLAPDYPGFGRSDQHKIADFD